MYVELRFTGNPGDRGCVRPSVALEHVVHLQIAVVLVVWQVLVSKGTSEVGGVDLLFHLRYRARRNGTHSHDILVQSGEERYAPQ